MTHNSQDIVNKHDESVTVLLAIVDAFMTSRIPYGLIKPSNKLLHTCLDVLF